MQHPVEPGATLWIGIFTFVCFLIDSEIGTSIGVVFSIDAIGTTIQHPGWIDYIGLILTIGSTVASWILLYYGVESLLWM